ncbi:hypothetical protein D3C85_174520 [compost metagenome]
MLGDVSAVAVVARVGTQLRRAGVEIADLQVEHDHAADHRDDDRQDDDHRRPTALGETIQTVPDMPQEAAILFAGAVLLDGDARGLLAHTDIGQRDRNQQQFGEDQHGHADAGGDGQVADHRNIDDHQHGEPDYIAQQCGEPGEEQAAKGVARRDVLVGAAADVLEDAIHLLRAMGNPDGEDQKRYQNRIRVQLVAEQLHQPQQPDHPRHRDTHQQQGAAQATGIEINEQRGDHHRGAEEHHHGVEPIDQIAHQLAEADDMNPDLVALQRADLFFQLAGELAVIQRLASLRMGVEQRRDYHARGRVVGHQAADDARPIDVTPQGADRGLAAIVVGRHYRAAIDTNLGHFLPTYDRHPQRLHPGTIDAGNQVERVVDLLQGLQVLRIVDITLLVRHHHPDAVTQTRQLILVGQVVLDVRAGARNHPLEAGIDLQPRRKETEYQRSEQARNDYQHAVTENNPLEEPPGRLVEVPKVRNHWHPAVVLLLYHFCSLTEGSYRQLILPGRSRRPGRRKNGSRPTCRPCRLHWLHGLPRHWPRATE